jgi:hypothetical protein
MAKQHKDIIVGKGVAARQKTADRFIEIHSRVWVAIMDQLDLSESQREDFGFGLYAGVLKCLVEMSKGRLKIERTELPKGKDHVT